MAKTPTKSIRIDDDLWADALFIAAERGETVTAIVVARLERYRKTHADLLTKRR